MDSKNLLVALRAFSEAYADACKPICRELGLPQMAFDILMFLGNNPDCSTAKEISRYRGFKENIISVNVNKLVNEGYLCRQEDPLDRRKVRLFCTEKASEIIRRGRQVQERFIRQMLEGLTPEQLQIHKNCLETIARNAKKQLEEKPKG